MNHKMKEEIVCGTISCMSAVSNIVVKLISKCDKLGELGYITIHNEYIILGG